MLTASIQQIRHVGVDSGVFEAFGQLPAKIAPGEIEQLVRAVEALPGVIEAIEVARDDPDNLYLTNTTQPGRDESLWPGSGEVIEMRPRQSAAPDVSFDIDGSRNLSLWDYDTVSRDDHLGSVAIDAIEAGQGAIGRLTSSQVEGSIYSIIYDIV